MTDERDLHDLAAPLLADPPHPPPPLDELERRVGRRRQRRARAIGLCSVVAVVLVAAGVLALPRDAELRAGDREAATPTTAPPPPFVPGPVQLVATPESAPLEADRTLDIRNTGTDPYVSCLGFNLFRWNGAGWDPTARLHLYGAAQRDEPPDLTEYEPLPPVVDCGVESVPAGASTSVPFRLGSATWHPEDGTTPPRTDRLADGWYEVREITAASNEPSRGLGRFQITAPGTEAGPPGLRPAPVQVVVTPEVAPLDSERTIEVRNTSDHAYSECGVRFDLHRWDGPRWQPVATMILAIEPDGYPESRLSPFVVAYDENPAQIQCAAITTIEPGSARHVTVNFADFADHEQAGSIPPAAVDPLVPGVYELRSFLGAESDLAALGRFEITDSPAPSVTTAPGLPPPPPTDLVPSARTGRVDVDVWPGEGLRPAGEVVPDEVLVLDDATVALTWSGSCNQPAESVQVTATETEVELRLRIGVFVTTDCMGEPDRWNLVVDLPFSVENRPLVARAEGTTDSRTVEAMPPRLPLPRIDDANVIDPQPVAFQYRSPSSPGDSIVLVVPYPIATPGRACALQVAVIDGTVIPIVTNGRSQSSAPTDTCSQLGFGPLGAERVFGLRG